MTALVILRPDDSVVLARIHAAAFEDAWSETGIHDQIAQASTLAIGAQHNGNLVGFICVQTVLDTAEILTIATHPAHQRRGIARSLLTAVTRRLAERGVGILHLDVAVDNTAALAFYESAAFRQDGLRKAYYKRDGGAVDAALMSKSLAI